MQTFLPYEDFAESAKVLDHIRLNSQINESTVIIKSLMGVYPPKKNGVSGWAEHTIAKMWKGHELQLARFSLALSNEYLLNRKLPSTDQSEALRSRQTRVRFFTELIEQMEDRDFPDTLPSLVGDEEFHSAFRALLLYKDIQSQTFKKWKAGEYTKNAITMSLLPKKSSWKRTDYERVWEYFGRPDPVWYAQWGWSEEPDDMRVFYSEDRVPQMQKEIERKKRKPFAPFLMPKEKVDE